MECSEQFQFLYISVVGIRRFFVIEDGLNSIFLDLFYREIVLFF
jgi:hypothetical protein